MHMQSRSTAASSNLELVMQFMERVWNDGNAEAVFEFLDESHIDHAYTPPNAQGHAAMVRMFNAAFSDIRHEVVQTVADDNAVVLCLWVHARHTGPFRGVQPDGSVVKVQQYRSFRVRSGKIVEHSALFDTLALLQQIGALGDEGLACRRAGPDAKQAVTR